MKSILTVIDVLKNNQTIAMTFADFPIVYNGITYMVDPFIFCYNSQRFRDIFHPGYSGFSQVTINGNFQPQSVDLFCSICQNQQVTIPPECINDIAVLARLFYAEPVVSSYIGNINANLAGSIIFENRRSINQAYDDFEWLNNGADNSTTNYNQSTSYSFESSYQNQYDSNQESIPVNQTFTESQPSYGQEINQTYGEMPPQSSGIIQEQSSGFTDQSQFPYQDSNQFPDQNQIPDQNPNQMPDQSQIPDQYQSYNGSQNTGSDGLADPMPYYTPTPTIYEVQVEKKLIKCNRYSLLQNGQVVATAKTRTGSIVLNIGVDAHFKQIEQSAGDVQRYSFLNIVRTDGKEHEVKFFRDADTGYMTLHAIFYINNDRLLLTGLKKLPKEKIFGTLKVLDESHPCNLFLKNGTTAMTFTQTSKSTFTIESYLKASMIFVFAMFMCAVTGPHTQFSNEFQGKE